MALWILGVWDVFHEYFFVCNYHSIHPFATAFAGVDGPQAAVDLRPNSRPRVHEGGKLHGVGDGHQRPWHQGHHISRRRLW